MFFPESWKRSCLNLYTHDCMLLSGFGHKMPRRLLFLKFFQTILCIFLIARYWFQLPGQCFKGFLSWKANLMSFPIKKWILKTLFLPKSLWNKPFAESLKNYHHGFNLNWFLSNSVNMIKNLPMTHAFMSELCHMALALVFQLGFPFTVSDIWYVPW